MGIKEEITKIAVEQGYEGAKPKSIAQAIDALTDTLAGEDVKSGRSVVDAIRKYAPYVGTGGGAERVELFNETVTTTEDAGGHFTAKLAFTGDITDDPLVVVFDGTEYKLPRHEITDTTMGISLVVYGPENGSDFSTYPLALSKTPAGWLVSTETAGTHTIVAYTDSATPTPTPMPTLGPLQNWPYMFTKAPDVGDDLTLSDSKPLSLSVSGTTICTKIYGYSVNNHGEIASGVTIDLTGVIVNNLYAVVGAGTISSVRELDIEVEVNPIINNSSFVMPELGEDETLYIKYTRGGIE